MAEPPKPEAGGHTRPTEGDDPPGSASCPGHDALAPVDVDLLTAGSHERGPYVTGAGDRGPSCAERSVRQDQPAVPLVGGAERFSRHSNSRPSTRSQRRPCADQQSRAHGAYTHASRSSPSPPSISTPSPIECAWPRPVKRRRQPSDKRSGPWSRRTRLGHSHRMLAGPRRLETGMAALASPKPKKRAPARLKSSSRNQSTCYRSTLPREGWTLGVKPCGSSNTPGAGLKRQSRCTTRVPNTLLRDSGWPSLRSSGVAVNQTDQHRASRASGQLIVRGSAARNCAVARIPRAGQQRGQPGFDR